MGIKIENRRACGLETDYYSRWYKISFKSRRNINPEPEIKLTYYTLNWVFTDTKLGFPLKVELTEKGIWEGEAKVICVIRGLREVDHPNVKKIDQYVCSQLEQIAKDGMVKL